MLPMEIEGERLKEQIHLLQGKNCQLTLIDKGYSSDRKYRVSLSEQHFLLRVFAAKSSESKRREYDVLAMMEEYGVRCSKPLEFGQLPEAEIGYMLLSYVEGVDASEELPHYSDSVQYQIGLEAGKELWKMHQLQAPRHAPDWYESKVSKYRRYSEQYKACGVRIRDDHKMISFIDEHLELMKNRPNSFQHDDFHLSNLIVKEGRLAGVIDFNRYDWGDPVHEFLKIGMFSKEVSVPFSIGQIHGYFEGKQPDDMFWKLYSLYTAMTVISSVVWILKVKPDETEQMLNRLYGVLDDHDYFEMVKPRWYRD
ncbi:aminoglycoside phosphotransferase family protein [Paenibacillus sp. NPDC056579]|uniref:aminoglycoside phosphotransferase family protein n=1 Tax=Paenibacillus sp. NPDC056579 TaxID=3345871 RepID=UPI00367B0F9A